MGITLLLTVLVMQNPPGVFADVTIASFAAQGGAGQIKLVWTTSSERKNWGFNVERSTDQKNWLHVGSNPSTKSQSPCIQNVMGASYELTDAGLTAGVQYYYRLQTYGQPCGDTSAYYEQIVSAVVNGPTATPTASIASPAATATTPGIATPIPSATGLPLPTVTPSRTPANPIATSSKTPARLAVAPSRATPTPANQNAMIPFSPSVQPSPVVEARLASREDPADSEDLTTPPATQSRMLDWRALVRGGVIGVAGLLGFASFVCGALAFFLFVRPHLWR
ncbi:MAG: hypothetical protein HY868_16085 [Chloroflexi bacterium]|nr:hypothetical protein [Chloroflexota bacterium]